MKNLNLRLEKTTKTVPCTTCGGSGKVGSNTCAKCGGTGTITIIYS